ncbi:MAG TPA: ShlB/FhaC/HecB family hemolysin secretion/activation protein [Mycobacterium sp.]
MDASRAVGGFASIIVAASLGLCFTVSAADAPTPGSVQDTLREPPRFPLEDGPADSVQTPPMPMRNIPGGGRPVVIDRFEVTGNSVISTPVLQSMLRRYEGATMTLEEIFGIADQLTSYYHAQGYGLATVTVPAQRVEDGVISLEVIEGRVAEVRFRGNSRFSSDYLGSQVTEVGGGQVFRTSAMEREALLLNDIPGVAATAVISPGAAYGTSDVTFNVTETPRQYRVSVDNYGRQTIGEWRMVADATFNGLHGRSDRFNIGGVISSGSRLRFGKMSYDMSVGTQGARLRFSANRSYYTVGGPVFIPLEISGYSNNFRVDYTRPIHRTRRQSTLIGVALTYTDAASYSGFVGSKISSTQIGLLELSWATQQRYASGTVGAMGVILATNFEPVDFDTVNSTLDGQQQRGRIELYSNFTIPISGQWNLLARARVQTSIDPLVDTQQLSLGGPTSVRGYGPSEIRGDRGVFLSAELFRYFHIEQYPASWSIFVDGGRVWRIVHQFSGPDTTDGIAGAGVGLVINPGGKFSARLEYARSIGGHTASDGDDNRFWANFVTEF